MKLLEMMARNKIRTIEELHRKTGISRRAISAILSGKKTGLRFETIVKLCQTLNCEIGELIVIKKDKVS